MRYRIEAPGQPVAEGDYLDEMEARAVVRQSGLVADMRTVKVTPLWDKRSVQHGSEEAEA